jgi:hypothetical protein
MIVQFDKAKWITDSEGTWLLLKVTFPQKVKDFVSGMKERVYDAELKEHREKRSLDANAALWKLLSMMAEVLHTTKDELYIEMLGRYGVFTHVVVKPSAVEMFKQEYRLCKDLGEVTINGKTGIQLQCYFGSSSYDTAQFSKLLDGVIQDGKEIGVELISADERDRMLSEWGK